MEAARRGDTRERVIAAAGELFAARGFHGTTMRDIAQRARVNLAAAHYHFGSKETLYLDVLRAQFAELMAQFDERGARLGPDTARVKRTALRMVLRTRVAAMLALLLGPPPGPHGTLMMREMSDPSAALPTIVDQFIMPHRREMEAIVAGLVPELTRTEVQRCVFSIVGQVFFYRHMLPALELMMARHDLDKDWMRDAADHITAFSLGGMERIAARRRAKRGRQ